jgi:hypothetical protein
MSDKRTPARASLQHGTAQWAACHVDAAIAASVRAMHTGTATEEQQKRFMLWLNTEASPLIGLGWSPDDERQSCFAAGRRFVALKIAEILKTPAAEYAAKPHLER